MKKLLLIAAAAMLTQYSANAQSMEITGKGAFKATGIFNNDISDAGDELDYDIPAFGYSAGAGFNIFFTPSIGLGTEVLMARHVGKYQGTIKDSSGAFTFNSEVILKSIDIPLMFKLQTKSGGASLDVGVQYSMISTATQKYSTEGFSESVVLPDSSYNKSNLAGILGLNVNIDLTEKLFLITGLRFEYGLGDIEMFGSKEKTYTGAAGLSLGLMYRIGGN